MNQSERPSSDFKITKIYYTKFFFEREEKLPKQFNLSTNVEIILKRHNEEKKKFLLQYRLNNIEIPDNPVKLDIVARLFFEYLGQKEDNISTEVTNFIKCNAIYQISASCNQMIFILASQSGIRNLTLPQPDGSIFDEKKK
jgi:hypothetical protein